MNDTEWIGPYKVSQLLNNFPDDEIRTPPHDPSVYAVTEAEWAPKPDRKATILYVGSNSSDSALFRVRIGSLIADLFGFYSAERGHHSGGQSLHKYCLEVGLDSSDLYIGWKAGSSALGALRIIYMIGSSPVSTERGPQGARFIIDATPRESAASLRAFLDLCCILT